MNEVLIINNLVTEFKNLMAIKNVSLKVNENEVVSIIGPSGSGKSTLLRTIFKLEKASSGDIIIDGKYILKNGFYEKNYKSSFLKLGMIFQDFNLFDNLNVFDNISLALKIVKKKNKDEINNKVMELLKMVNLENKIYNYPSTLSGGEKQRIAICRALAMEPNILLLDEPTSALDNETINDLIKTLNLLKSKNMTMLIVTHDLNFAKKISDRIIFMEKGEIIVDEKVDYLYNNSNERLDKFINLRD